MKRFLSFVFACTACALSQAQDIEVFEVTQVDGTSHTYAVDSLSRIRFGLSGRPTDFASLYPGDTVVVTDTLYLPPAHESAVDSIEGFYRLRDSIWFGSVTPPSFLLTAWSQGTSFTYGAPDAVLSAAGRLSASADPVEVPTQGEDTVFLLFNDADLSYRVLNPQVLSALGSGGDDGILVLTFEDADYAGESATYWSDKIDSPQYGGSILYGDYATIDGSLSAWNDPTTTLVYDGLTTMYWSGGLAVSNYYEDPATASYLTQLSVNTTPSPGYGADGSANFVVGYAYKDESSYSSFMTPPSVYSTQDTFLPQYCYVTLTSYTINSLTYGDSFASAATEESEFWVVAEGTKADGTTVTARYYLCKDGHIENEWVKFDLTSLGEVEELCFYVQGSDDLSGAYGLNTPGYFALDNLAIKLP